MSPRTVSAWALFAIIGLALAVGVSLAASRLTGEHVALSSEPIRADESLVPPTPTPRARPRPKRHPRKRREQRAPAATAPAPPPHVTSPPAYTPPPAPQTTPKKRSPARSPSTKPREREVEHEDD